MPNQNYIGKSEIFYNLPNISYIPNKISVNEPSKTCFFMNLPSGGWANSDRTTCQTQLPRICKINLGKVYLICNMSEIIENGRQVVKNQRKIIMIPTRLMTIAANKYHVPRDGLQLMVLVIWPSLKKSHGSKPKESAKD